MNWEKDYSAAASYSQSKLANVLFTIELAKRLEGVIKWGLIRIKIFNFFFKSGTGCTTVSLHPGSVNTDLMRNLHGCLGCLGACLLPCARLCFLKTPQQGAATTIYCATSPNIPNHAGAYFR